ncbi:MAG: RHS repeat-associated core domain-containing protein, partial [Planctomycetaceae bacterium]|nr:RHS repeat-associated core domain-containing protein [Planctomycetaceae bacterium]
MELYAFDAYGNAIGFDPSVALTEFLYSGEQFDSKIGQQYLRARYYDTATGRFNRFDPFFGNLNDPQSLHKYLYTHADPINGIDPSGLMSLASMMPAITIGRLASFSLTALRVVTPILLKGVYHLWIFSELMNVTAEISNHITKLCVTGHGGYNVTQKLFKLREDVINKWKALNNNQKSKLINSLYNPLQGLVAWDIHSMAFAMKKDWTENLLGSPLEETLTFQGKVYPVAEVNYVLWGLINRLAYDDGFSYTGYLSTYAYAYGYRSILGGITVMQNFGTSFFTGDNFPRFATDVPSRNFLVLKNWGFCENVPIKIFCRKIFILVCIDAFG